jgi:clan AA aspartic protease (TIGR02281 family)
MMKILRIFFLMGLLLLLRNTSLSAEIYRWKNSSGQTHYSTSPPPYHVDGPVEVKRNNRWSPYTGDEIPDLSKTKRKPPINDTASTPGKALQGSETRQDQSIVSYSKQESMIIIQVMINQKITRPFAVDTGATYTVISQEIADALYLRPKPKVPLITLQTANGRIQVPLVNLDSVTVGGLKTPNITAAIHNFDDSSDVSGLLGLNFLNRFQMTVDSTNNQLIFKPIHSLSHYEKRDCVSARELLRRARTLNDGSEREASYYRKAISLCHDLVEAYYYLGAIYINQKDAQRAINLHRKLIQMQPDEPEAYFRLGVAYMLERKFHQAKKEFRRALQLNPDHKQSAEYLERLKNR